MPHVMTDLGKRSRLLALGLLPTALMVLGASCLLLLAATQLFWWELADSLWILSVFVELFLAGMLLIFIVAMLFVGIRRRMWPMLMSAALLMALGAVVWIYGTRLGTQLRFA
jgi:hypothetical protein